jgi:hypothetical protein
MASAILDPEFTAVRLRRRIVEGALRDDPVRLHGAIFAALEIHRPMAAVEHICTPALADLRRGRSLPARNRAEAAIVAHVRSWRASGRRFPQA